MKLDSLKGVFVLGLMTTFMSQGSLAADDTDQTALSTTDDKYASQLMASMQKNGAVSLCRKGNAKKKVVSMRSFEGRLCKNKYYGALAEVVCSKDNKEDYLNSGCHNNAVAALKGQEAEDVLEEGVKKGAGKVRAMVCNKVLAEGKNPKIKKIAGKYCQKAADKDAAKAAARN